MSAKWKFQSVRPLCKYNQIFLTNLSLRGKKSVKLAENDNRFDRFNNFLVGCLLNKNLTFTFGGAATTSDLIAVLL